MTTNMAVHPGAFFLAEILDELNLSQAALARAIGISPMRISHVVNAARPITADLALFSARRCISRPNTGAVS